MTTTLSQTEFNIDISDRALERNLPQKAGTRLWLPMLAMALMAFPLGVILAFVRSNAISTGGDATTIVSLGHFGPAVMFIGFASVFAAISFAIARILGELRVGGGTLQESTGAPVETLKMPATARAFIGLMMIAMMAIIGGVIAHFIVGAQIAGGQSVVRSAAPLVGAFGALFLNFINSPGLSPGEFTFAHHDIIQVWALAVEGFCYTCSHIPVYTLRSSPVLKDLSCQCKIKIILSDFIML